MRFFKCFSFKRIVISSSVCLVNMIMLFIMEFCFGFVVGLILVIGD